MSVLSGIPDPEMPINIVDLGLVEQVTIDGNTVRIVMLPNIVGCPALDMIREDVETEIGAIDGVGTVEVTWVFDPAWSVDRITDAGRDSLREHGVTVPEHGRLVPTPSVTLRTSAVPCPFCGSDRTRLDSPFGPTRCRSIYYCDACRNAFEHMKRIAASEAD